MSYILTNWDNLRHSDGYVTAPALCRALNQLTIREAYRWLHEAGYELQLDTEGFDFCCFKLEEAFIWYDRPLRNRPGRWVYAV